MTIHWGYEQPTSSHVPKESSPPSFSIHHLPIAPPIMMRSHLCWMCLILHTSCADYHCFCTLIYTTAKSCLEIDLLPNLLYKKNLLIKFPENCKALVEENEKDILSGNISKVCVRINTMKMSVLFKGVHEQYLLTSVTLFIYFI